MQNPVDQYRAARSSPEQPGAARSSREQCGAVQRQAEPAEPESFFYRRHENRGGAGELLFIDTPYCTERVRPSRNIPLHSIATACAFWGVAGTRRRRGLKCAAPAARSGSRASGSLVRLASWTECTLQCERRLSVHKNVQGSQNNPLAPNVEKSSVQQVQGAQNEWDVICGMHCLRGTCEVLGIYGRRGVRGACPVLFERG
eukprot:gene8735-biopygen22656